ncbi:hypothetical protein NITUZ_40215 [Candidatus Nitrosotenuis uzonensis]|uniref:Uncharacterized protein n=1 Tax=Candidatus Nitrosotenuis uzonensis TaxID=1407055 RepID=V6ATY6_9ARCH|nr:hypothetical protein NITUZ_40215 [Candidatus Nitrosotenuis uzonensis]
MHFAKTGEIGERTFDTDYVDEVRWIRPSKYDSEYRPDVEADDLLTPDELVSILSHTSCQQISNGRQVDGYVYVRRSVQTWRNIADENRSKI